MEKKYFISFDKKEIPYLYYESKRKDMKNNIIIFHGMAEPVNRYDEFSNFLSANGYNVYVMELRGHGELRDGNYGDFGKKGIKNIYDDIKIFFDILSENGIDSNNTVIFGHSMGSLITMELAIKMKYKHIILSGFPLRKKGMSLIGLVVSFLESLIFFKKNSIFNKQFKKYNDFFAPTKTKSDWLSRDEEEVLKFTQDENCGYPVTPKFFYGIFKTMNFINYNYKKILKDTKILFIYGTEDKAMDIDYSNKILKKLQKKKRKINILSNENGRHESLKEINKYVIYDEILKWLNIVLK